MGKKLAIISYLFVLSRVDKQTTIRSEMTKVRKYLLLAEACISNSLLQGLLPVSLKYVIGYCLQDNRTLPFSDWDLGDKTDTQKV